MGEWNGIYIDTFEWQGREWIARPIWGEHHEDDDFTWFDSDLPKPDDAGCLVLPVEYKPRTFVSGDKSTVKPWARCFVRSLGEFKYGTFEWEMRCPEAKWQWPALWLESDFSWPPEIDCMEGWSRDTRDYSKLLFFRNIKPSVHWSASDGTHEFKTKHNILKCRLKCGKNFDKYRVVWTPDRVDIYYNASRVAHFTEKKLLEMLNHPECNMHAVMSSGPYGKFDADELTEMDRGDRHMVVKSFSYTSL